MPRLTALPAVQTVLPNPLVAVTVNASGIAQTIISVGQQADGNPIGSGMVAAGTYQSFYGNDTWLSTYQQPIDAAVAVAIGSSPPHFPHTTIPVNVQEPNYENALRGIIRIDDDAQGEPINNLDLSGYYMNITYNPSSGFWSGQARLQQGQQVALLNIDNFVVNPAEPSGTIGFRITKIFYNVRTVPHDIFQPRTIPVLYITSSWTGIFCEYFSGAILLQSRPRVYTQWPYQNADSFYGGGPAVHFRLYP